MLSRRIAIVVDVQRTLGVGERIEHADRPAVAELARDFRCAEDCGFGWCGDEVCVDAALRLTTNATRIKHLRAIEEIEVAARRRIAKREDVQTLGEKRTLLRIERLEHAEIHDRGIDLDLAEIGIDRAGERERRRQRVLQIETAVDALLLTIEQRIVAIGAREHVAARDRVRHDLQRTLAPDAFETAEVGEVRDETCVAFSRVDDAHPLVVAHRAARDVDAPRVHRLVGKAKLRERYAHFGDPAIRDDATLRLPHAIPASVLADVVEQNRIDLHVRRRDRECIAR